MGEAAFYWITTKEKIFFASLRELSIFALENDLKISIFNPNIEESLSMESIETDSPSVSLLGDIEKKEKPIETPVTDWVKEKAITWYGWAEEVGKKGGLYHIAGVACVLIGSVIEIASEIIPVESMEKNIRRILKGDDVVKNLAILAWKATGSKIRKSIGKAFKIMKFPTTKKAFKQGSLAALKQFKWWWKGNRVRMSSKWREIYEPALKKIDRVFQIYKASKAINTPKL